MQIFCINAYRKPELVRLSKIDAVKQNQRHGKELAHINIITKN